MDFEIERFTSEGTALSSSSPSCSVSLCRMSKPYLKGLSSLPRPKHTVPQAVVYFSVAAISRHSGRGTKSRRLGSSSTPNLPGPPRLANHACSSDLNILIYKKKRQGNLFSVCRQGSPQSHHHPIPDPLK